MALISLSKPQHSGSMNFFGNNNIYRTKVLIRNKTLEHTRAPIIDKWLDNPHDSDNATEICKLEMRRTHGDTMHYFLSECTDPNCIYSRSRSKLRYLYEDIIVSHCISRERVNIMFYASHNLLQELIILKKIAHCVDEVHLVDLSYENVDNYYNAFTFFSSEIRRINPYIKIYHHHNLLLLEGNRLFLHRIDLIGGIDIDYIHNKFDHLVHRRLIHKIANYVLKIGGKLIISQHFNDIVDMAEYQQNSQYLLVPVTINDFVKPDFYYDYISKHNHNKNVPYRHNIHPISSILV